MDTLEDLLWDKKVLKKSIAEDIKRLKKYQIEQGDSVSHLMFMMVDYNQRYLTEKFNLYEKDEMNEKQYELDFET